MAVPGWFQRRILHLLLVIYLVLNLLCASAVANMFKYQLDKSNNNDARVQRNSLSLADLPQELNNLFGKPGQGSYTEVAIGTPPQKFNVLVDTGSSNFAIACEDHPDITTYFRRENSSTYQDSGTTVNVPYTEGSWDGVLGTDFISVTSLPSIRVRANIACITQAKNFFINGSHWQGILGLGYAGIARPDTSVKPFFDSMVEQADVADVFSMQMCGAVKASSNPNDDLAGSLIFGGMNMSLSKGPLYSTPIYKEWYYEVVIVDIEVNGASLGMDCKEYNFEKTIVDSGTTNLRLPKRVFKGLIAAIKRDLKLSEAPSADFWSGEEVICWTKGLVPYDQFPVISIALPVNDIAAFKLVLTPQQYLRAVGAEDGEEYVVPGKDCFKFAIADSDSGAVLGAVVMEGYYVVFNRQDRIIQFTETTCSALDPASVNSTISMYQEYTGNYRDCAYKKPENSRATLQIVGYVLGAICGICLLPLVILTVQWQCRKRGCRRSTLKRTNSDSNGLVDDS